ncbi:MAG TPA: RagB/SusD family nutrient uptake outer membrane protein [Fodinibius sp.]|nr:RagB/SusD family nutrient uptake outer membrane protein [Fodinibius sp.]
MFTPNNYYDNESSILTSLSGVYRDFATLSSMGPSYRVLELTTDQVVVHAKIQGWWDGPDFHNLARHEWTPSHAWIGAFWDKLFGTVGQANALINSLSNSDLDGLEGPIAELRALRAYAYFYLMDLYGNVPIFTEPKVDPNNLPTQNTRTEVFNFVIEELSAAAEVLPSANDVGDEYYGRLTKEAVYALMAITYLNAEVYTGEPQYDMAVEYADRVINSGAYRLLDNYFANFSYDNANNDEMIFGSVYTPNETGGIGHPFVLKVLPGIGGGLFGLPYTPQNGFGTRPSVVELYEDQDVRKNMFLGPGPLIDPRTGDTVMVERIVPDGNSTLYMPGESTEGPVPYKIIKATGLRNQPMNAGIKWIKWGLDPNTNGGDAGNDIAWIRYAGILLVKAEAQFRLGTGNPLALVNRVRERSNASLLSSLTLQDLLDERGRELAFEMTRRRDLIRFGQFTSGSWEFKEPSEEYRRLFPIPTEALDANRNLEQNPGY